MNTNIYKCSRL